MRREKSQHVFDNMIGSRWKYLEQQIQPSNKQPPVMEVTKAQGGSVPCSSEMRRNQGKNRQVHAFLPSLPPAPWIQNLTESCGF